SYVICLSGSALYLQTDSGISMWDVSDAGNPISKGTFEIPIDSTSVRWLALGDDGRLYASGYAYTPDPIGKMLAINITSPFAPQIESELSGLPYSVGAAEVRNGIGFIPGSDGGLITARIGGTIAQR